ncbi:MAG TPA: hypothetical protein VGR47_00380 [Terracidiphilus sp.]|nr:hypothetical protein [Terracidiphilus sp.]
MAKLVLCFGFRQLSTRREQIGKPAMYLEIRIMTSIIPGIRFRNYCCVICNIPCGDENTRIVP